MREYRLVTDLKPACRTIAMRTTFTSGNIAVTVRQQ